MSNDKIEQAIRILAQHAPTDARQQIEALLPAKDEAEPADEVTEKPKAKRRAA